MRISKELSNKFANMALLCAMLVVGIHFHLNPIGGTMVWCVDTILFKAIASVAVPFFFVASGYFLATHCSERGWWAHAIKHRLVTLMVPYLFWCCVWLLFFSLLVPIANNFRQGIWAFDGVRLPSARHVFSALGLDPFANPATPALWYVRALFMYVLISPMLLRLANVGGVCLLFVIYLIVCPSSALIKVHHNFFLLRFFFSLEGLFYFTLGMFLRINSDFVSKKWQANVVHLVGAALLAVYLILSLTGFPYSYYVVTLSIPLWMFTVWCVMPCKALPYWLGKCAFPLFVLHQFFIAIISIATRGFFGRAACEAHIARAILFYLIVIMFCLVVSWATHKVKLLSVMLWGGR